MYAIMISSPLPAERLEMATAAFKTNSEILGNSSGFLGGYWIYDHENSVASAVVLFDSPEHREAAWEEGQKRVQAAGEALGVTPEVRLGEVVHHLG